MNAVNVVYYDNISLFTSGGKEVAELVQSSTGHTGWLLQMAPKISARLESMDYRSVRTTVGLLISRPKPISKFQTSAIKTLQSVASGIRMKDEHAQNRINAMRSLEFQKDLAREVQRSRGAAPFSNNAVC